MQNTEGFTLIEMMVVVAIIAILSAIAYPSYLDQVRRSNRSDAKVALTDVAQRLERCYTTFGAYNAGACATATALADGVASTEGYYTVTVANHTATTYTLTATPLIAPQTGDSSCPTLTLNQLSERAPATCW